MVTREARGRVQVRRVDIQGGGGGQQWFVSSRLVGVTHFLRGASAHQDVEARPPLRRQVVLHRGGSGQVRVVMRTQSEGGGGVIILWVNGAVGDGAAGALPVCGCMVTVEPA